MITLFLKAKNPLKNVVPPVVYSGNYKGGHQPTYNGAIVSSTGNLLPQHEYLKRNKLIQKLVEEFPYSVGDRVETVADNGVWVIQEIYKNWFEYKGNEVDELKVEWPKDDNPKLIGIINVKSKQRLIATTNYIKCLAP